MKGAVEGGEGIKRDIGNIKYKCNLPRFMSAEERRVSRGEKRKKKKKKETMEKEEKEDGRGEQKGWGRREA